MARRPPRAPFVATFAAVAALSAGALALGGCDGAIEPEGTSDGGPPPSPTVNPVDCPASMPQQASACPRDGMHCVFSRHAACNNAPREEATCQNGKWSLSSSSCNPPRPEPPACPDSNPTLGSPCNVNGLRCNFPDGCPPGPFNTGTDTLVCSGGTWQHTAPPYPATCPISPPAHGSYCGSCRHYFSDCKYDDCYGYPTTIASCSRQTGTWSVARVSCNPPPPPFDAGFGDN